MKKENINLHLLLAIVMFSFIFTSNVQAETYSNGSTSTVTGKIVVWTSNSISSGYLLCNGQAVSRTTYANLYKIIGTTYGSGDGSTTFNLPNMQDRVVIGSSASNALGSTGGKSTAALTVANLPSHNHSIPALSGTAASAGAHQHYVDPVNSAARAITLGNKNNNVTNVGTGGRYDQNWGFMGAGGGNGWYPNWNKGRTQKTASSGAHTHSVTTTASTTGSTGSGSAFSVQNSYITENYIIKY